MDINPTVNSNTIGGNFKDGSATGTENQQVTIPRSASSLDNSEVLNTIRWIIGNQIQYGDVGQRNEGGLSRYIHCYCFRLKYHPWARPIGVGFNQAPADRVGVGGINAETAGGINLSIGGVKGNPIGTVVKAIVIRITQINAKDIRSR